MTREVSPGTPPRVPRNRLAFSLTAAAAAIVLLFLVAVSLLVTTLPAAGQMAILQVACADKAEARARLLNQHDERVSIRGMGREGQMIFELFVSPAGTWTATLTGLDNRTCLIAAGVDAAQLMKSLRPQGPGL